MSDYDYSDTEEDIKVCLKEDYTLNDFLNNKITGPILYENAINKYENIANIITVNHKGKIVLFL